MTDEPNRREQAIADMIARTGKTREQIEAFMEITAHSMGWRPRMTDDEFRATYATFLGTDETGA